MKNKFLYKKKRSLVELKYDMILVYMKYGILLTTFFFSFPPHFSTFEFPIQFFFVHGPLTSGVNEPIIHISHTPVLRYYNIGKSSKVTT